MAYNVTLKMPAQYLADVERGSPSRHYVAQTLTAAVQISNAAAFCAGLGMRRGPRSIAVGQCYQMRSPSDHLQIEIARVK